MQVQVVSDAQGRIISLSRMGDVGEQVSGITRAGVFAEKDQHVHLVELPEEHRETPLVELHERLRLDVWSGRPRLVPAEKFVEPYLRGPGLSESASQRSESEGGA